ncbi:MAG: phage tail assembly protein [Epsilonproteobacteria bacterium]|nr:phage tail assembly protein [Campylobacterota bacterium]
MKEQNVKHIKLTNSKTVTMRAPKVGDLRAIKGVQDEEERELALIANLTGLTQDELDEMELKEYRKLQAALMELGGFLERPGATF